MHKMTAQHLFSELLIYHTKEMNPLPYERNNVSTTSTGTDFPVAYNDGMPQQTQNPANAHTRFGLMPHTRI
jgi:hypothetical protein